MANRIRNTDSRTSRDDFEETFASILERHPESALPEDRESYEKFTAAREQRIAAFTKIDEPVSYDYTPEPEPRPQPKPAPARRREEPHSTESYGYEDPLGSFGLDEGRGSPRRTQEKTMERTAVRSIPVKAPAKGSRSRFPVIPVACGMFAVSAMLFFITLATAGLFG